MERECKGYKGLDCKRSEGMIIVGKEDFERTCTVKNSKLGMISTEL